MGSGGGATCVQSLRENWMCRVILAYKTSRWAKSVQSNRNRCHQCNWIALVSFASVWAVAMGERTHARRIAFNSHFAQCGRHRWTNRATYSTQSHRLPARFASSISLSIKSILRIRMRDEYGGLCARLIGLRPAVAVLGVYSWDIERVAQMYVSR